MIAYLVVFGASALTSFAATPLVRRIAVRMGAIYQPNDRTVHAVPTPTVGGAGLFLGLLVGLAVSRSLPFFDAMNAASAEPLGALLACTAILGLGVVDDLRGISALTKLTGQIFCAGILVLAGVQLQYFVLPGNPYTVVSLGADLAVPFTVLWVVLIVNAVNLVDGLDGLAAGMVAIATGTFFVYMVSSGSLFGTASAAALLSCIAAGVCIGFLPWNFHPAKIFMGDSGAMLLGMLVAVATISGVGRNPFPPSPGDLAVIAIPLLVPLLVLAVPFLDVVLAIARRARRNVGLGQADKEHIHHRLMDIGHSHRQAVLLMYLWSGLIAASALAVGLIDGRLAAGLVSLAAGLLFLATALPRLVDRRRHQAGTDPTT
ncbi:MAG: undecaprenyl/decaprenyl-phosphate alpha-N-acetylglucosaminyl 1-phosphate transferase [Actinobacteria bacterium]|nr:undecaprenyl/decaprenyl-phosphate alpha-N-acetylglucosaminyl 1-phosphate transferase [Actinomycetota bacterium]